MLSTRWSPVPELEGIREEGFVLYKALTQTSSWVSCDSNPFICFPSLPPYKALAKYVNLPTYANLSYSAECDFLKAKTPDLALDTCGMKSTFLYAQIHNTDTNPHTHRLSLRAHMQIPRYVQAYTVHVCTREVKPLCRGELWEQLFLCISGLPVWIREKAALPPLNVSWCLPGCLFWEQIKGGPLPLAPTKGERRERGAEGAREGNRGGWMSFYKAGLMGGWMDGFGDGCLGGWIQTYVTSGSHLICNAYVLLPFTYGQNATRGSCSWSKMK